MTVDNLCHQQLPLPEDHPIAHNGIGELCRKKNKAYFSLLFNKQTKYVHTSEYAQNILLTKVLSQTLEPQSMHPYLSRNQNTERLSCIQPEMKMFLGDKCESIFLCIKLILNVNQKTSFLHDEWHQNVRKGLSMLLS